MDNLQVIEEREILGKQFRIYGDKENLLILAKDVANWIEHTHITHMLKTVDEDEKLNVTIVHAGQNREVTMLTENGLYEVLMQSRKPIAKLFKKEVKKILKQIRKTGGYIQVSQEESDEEFLAKALLIAQNTLKKKDELLKAKTKDLEEKNRFINQIAASQNSILVRDLAHLITKHNMRIGEKRLWEKLREWKLISKDSTKPYQRSLEQGLFEVTEGAKTTNNSTFTYCTTRVTGKGQEYIIKRLLKECEEV